MIAVPLEVNTKSASRMGKKRFIWTPRGADVEGFSPDDLAVFKRALRWQRKRAIEFLIPHDKNTKDKLSRVSKCYVMRIQKTVSILQTRKYQRAHFGGLMVCGSVWVCPVCAAKITERRRIELESADVEKFSSFMVTITLQHSKRDKLKKLIDDLGEAWRMVTAGSGWQKIKKKYRLAGSVTGREITYGIDNGWHPHLHILYYSRLPLDKINADEIRDHVSDRFIASVKKVGGYASPLHAVKVTIGSDRYMAKVGLDDDKNNNTWNLNAEITKGPAKMGMAHGDHYVPFQLADLYMCGDLVAGQRFIEYGEAMKGRRQLTYSRGLRDLLKIGAETTDQELAEAQDQEARLFATLSPEAWRTVLQRSKRGAILEVASTGNYQQFRTYCQAIGIRDLPDECP